jgi:hypothetical protein
VTTALLCCAYISGALHSGGLQRGTPEYADAQNVGATTVYEQLNMMVGPETNRLRTSKSCGAMILLRSRCFGI